MTKRMLTKTSYLSFTQGNKRFWLDAFQPDLATAPDARLSHNLLGGQNETQAEVVWEQTIGEGETAVQEQLSDQPRAYCYLHTWATIKNQRSLLTFRQASQP